MFRVGYRGFVMMIFYLLGTFYRIFINGEIPMKKPITIHTIKLDISLFYLLNFFGPLCEVSFKDAFSTAAL